MYRMQSHVVERILNEIEMMGAVPCNAEKRSAKRVQSTMFVECFSGGRQYVCKTLNVSAGGIAMECNKLPVAGNRIHITFMEVGAGNVCMPKAVGKIVWTRPATSESTGSFGVSFTAVQNVFKIG